MIYTVTLNPALDKTIQVDDFQIDAVNRVSSSREDPGGKGINVSRVIGKLGGTSRAAVILGGATGSKIEAALNEEGVACWTFMIFGESRTNLKVVDVKRGTNTDINEPGPEIPEGLLERVISCLLAELKPGDVVVLSGSLPKGVPTDIYAQWCRRITEAGGLVFLDADGAALREGLAAKPYLAKPNDAELSRLVGRELTRIDEIVDAAREIVASGVEHVVVSLGGSGAVFVSADKVLRAYSPKVDVVSTVGAGDSVVATLAYAHDEGLDTQEAIRLSMAAGSAAVMQPGTMAPERSLIDELAQKVEIEEL